MTSVVVSTRLVGTAVPASIVGTTAVTGVVPTRIVGTVVPTIIVLTAYYWKSCLLSSLASYPGLLQSVLLTMPREVVDIVLRKVYIFIKRKKEKIFL